MNTGYVAVIISLAEVCHRSANNSNYHTHLPDSPPVDHENQLTYLMITITGVS